MFYKILIPLEQGKQDTESLDPKEAAKIERMKGFLQAHFNTDKVQNIEFADLKQKIQGESVVSRLKYRNKKESKAKKNVGKNEIYRQESQQARLLSQDQQHPDFGFFCLHYAVSESSGFIRLKVHNKKDQKDVSIGIRTREIAGGAQAGKDFIAIDEKILFSGNETAEIDIKVIDDEQWEPDKEFKVELYDAKTGETLDQKDTKCTVLILDDDKPGFLSFGSKKTNVKHIATDSTCNITVKRTKGSDGKISCKYRTIQLANQVGHVGEPGKDYVHQEGTLNFDHNVVEQVIKIEILQHPTEEGAEEGELADRDEVFGL